MLITLLPDTLSVISASRSICRVHENSAILSVGVGVRVPHGVLGLLPWLLCLIYTRWRCLNGCINTLTRYLPSLTRTFSHSVRLCCSRVSGKGRKEVLPLSRQFKIDGCLVSYKYEPCCDSRYQAFGVTTFRYKARCMAMPNDEYRSSLVRQAHNGICS